MNNKEVTDLMHQFLDRQIDAEIFCDRLTDLWILNRDEIDARKLNWSRPYDLELQDALFRGEISKEQFEDQWLELWGLQGAEEFQDMIDRLHSTFHVYNPVPELPWQIDEKELRQEVEKELLTFEAILPSTDEL